MARKVSRAARLMTDGRGLMLGIGLVAAASLVLALGCATLCGRKPSEPARRPAVPPQAVSKFQPNWESLKQYQCPDWFRDAKFGIWAHWSAQCVPEHGDWYARGMYEQGSGHYTYHLEHYGHPSVFGFKDICNLWKAEKWDPDRLIKLYKQAGAKYFVALANHHCNFDCWDSTYQPWNSVNIGPKKDIVGTWAKAARKQGLRFGVTVHCARSWDWYDVAHGSDKTGPLAGVSYDGNLTKADGKGTWWEGYDPQDLYGPPMNARTPQARQAYVDKWFCRTKDLIDKYDPDLLYFDDSRLPLADAGLKIAAHLYNANLRRHEAKLEAVLTTKDMPEDLRGTLVWDIERGRSDRLEPFPWQTDTCIGEWHYHKGIRYASARDVITQLVDIVSKNGNLLLNIPVRGDGTIDEDEEKFLEEMAAWIRVNGDAIYGTRPWIVFGEGPKQAGGYTARNIRFTTKGNALYAIALGWPSDGTLTVTSLAKLPETTGKVTDVSLLGHRGKLQWVHDEKGLTVTMPSEKPCEHAFTLKIAGEELRGFRPDLVVASAAQPVRPGPDGSLTLVAEEAELHGSTIKVEQRTDRPNIGYWNSAQEWASWKVKFPEAATYDVTARCAAMAGPTEFVVELAGQSLAGNAPKTASWDEYAEVKLGKVEIKAPGDQVVTVRPKDAQTWKAMNLTTVKMVKAK